MIGDCQSAGRDRGEGIKRGMGGGERATRDGLLYSCNARPMTMNEEVEETGKVARSVRLRKSVGREDHDRL